MNRLFLLVSMPVLVRKPEVYVYTIALEHLEQPGEQLDAGKRAYHSLTTSFVWDQPNVTHSPQAILYVQIGRWPTWGILRIRTPGSAVASSL